MHKLENTSAWVLALQINNNAGPVLLSDGFIEHLRRDKGANKPFEGTALDGKFSAVDLKGYAWLVTHDDSTILVTNAEAIAPDLIYAYCPNWHENGAQGRYRVFNLAYIAEIRL